MLSRKPRYPTHTQHIQENFGLNASVDGWKGAQAPSVNDNDIPVGVSASFGGEVQQGTCHFLLVAHSSQGHHALGHFNVLPVAAAATTAGVGFDDGL